MDDELFAIASYPRPSQIVWTPSRSIIKLTLKIGGVRIARAPFRPDYPRRHRIQTRNNVSEFAKYQLNELNYLLDAMNIARKHVEPSVSPVSDVPIVAFAPPPKTELAGRMDVDIPVISFVLPPQVVTIQDDEEDYRGGRQFRGW